MKLLVNIEIDIKPLRRTPGTAVQNATRTEYKWTAHDEEELWSASGKTISYQEAVVSAGRHVEKITSFVEKLLAETYA